MLIVLAITTFMTAVGYAPALAQDESPHTPAAADVAATPTPDPFAVTPDDFLALKIHAARLAEREDGEFDLGNYFATLRVGLAELQAVGLDGKRTGPFDVSTIKRGVPVPGIDDDREATLGLSLKLERGISGDTELRIVGGDPAEGGEFTETVAIVSDHDMVCSGTVIAKDAVLTAAHCVCRMQIGPGQDGRAEVYFGNPDAIGHSSQSRSALINNARTLLPADRDICGEIKKGRMCGLDIAVVRFAAALLPEYVEVADVATPAQGMRFLDSSVAFIAGYGATSERQRRALQPARLAAGQTFPKNFARPPLPKKCGWKGRHRLCSVGTYDWGCHPEQEFVLRDPGVDACVGDSGGPVFLRQRGPIADQPRKKQIVVGVTSRGLSRSEICGLGGVYGTVFNPAARKILDKVVN